MAAQVEHPINTVSPGAGTGSVSQGSGGGLMQNSCGPAALAQNLIYEIMALYATIIGDNQKQKATSIQAQSDAAISESNATIAGGTALAVTTVIAGLVTIGSAVAVWRFSRGSSEEMDIAEEKSANLKSDMKPMQNLEKIDQNFGAEERELVPGNPDQEIVAGRVRELDSGRYAGECDPSDEKDVTVRAVRQMKRRGGEDYQRFKDEIREKLSNKTKELNTVTSDYTNANQNRQQVANSLRPGLDALGTISQGVGSTLKANQDANASLARTTSSMAASTSQDFGANMTKAYDAQNQEVQVLEAINRTNSVNG